MFLKRQNTKNEYKALAYFRLKKYREVYHSDTCTSWFGGFQSMKTKIMPYPASQQHQRNISLKIPTMRD